MPTALARGTILRKNPMARAAGGGGRATADSGHDDVINLCGSDVADQRPVYVWCLTQYRTPQHPDIPFDPPYPAPTRHLISAGERSPGNAFGIHDRPESGERERGERDDDDEYSSVCAHHSRVTAHFPRDS